MNLNEKLQWLRKQKKWTQEELAGMLYVSRTAVSKWESGRGCPGIDSLQAISKVFSISIDELLSSDELVAFTEKGQKEKVSRAHNTVFGILDCMAVLLFILPLFGQRENGMIVTVPLFAFTDTKGYICAAYVLIIVLLAGWGIVQLALHNWQNPIWLKGRMMFSLMLGVAAVMFTIASRHPYPNLYMLCLLLVKGIFLQKRA